MSENKPTFWDRATKFMVGTAAVVLMAVGGKSLIEEKSQDVKQNTIENINQKQDDSAHHRTSFRRNSPIRMFREAQQALKEKGALETTGSQTQKKIDEVRKKSQNLQKRKSDTTQDVKQQNTHSETGARTAINRGVSSRASSEGQSL